MALLSNFNPGCTPLIPCSSKMTLPFPCKLHFIQNLTMIHMDKCIGYLTHPRTFILPMDSKLQEEDVVQHCKWDLVASMTTYGATASPCWHQ